jgi:PAS domain S-box-containing protein
MKDGEKISDQLNAERTRPDPQAQAAGDFVAPGSSPIPELLRESNEFYRSLFTSMLNGYAYCKMLFEDGRPCDFIYLDVNPAFETLTGLRNVIGKKVSEVIPGMQESNPEVFDIYGRVATTGWPDRFEIFLSILGIWLDVSVFCPAENYFVALFENITHRKLAEEKLRESEERFRMAFYISPDAININRLEDGLFVDINEGFAKLTGYTRDDVIGRTSLDVALWCNREDRETLLRGLKEQGYYENLEADFRRKDGSVGRGLMSARVIHLQGVPHILSITRDITERKRAEEERRVLEARLQRAEKMEAIGTLAGGIAHDFNNILMAMIGFTELVRIEEDREARNESLAQVMVACNRAKDLVNQILTFSRMQETEKQPIQLNPLIKEGVKLLRSSIPSTIEIREAIETRPTVVIANPTQIHQVLMNLCANSAHAMRLGGGILQISLQQDEIGRGPAPATHGLAPGRYAKLAVSDTGQGIDEAHLDRIFDPFYTTKPQGEGTGLGLSVVYGIVKSCGGAVEAASKPGRGTTVTVYLPLAASAGPVAARVEPETPGGHERLLFVDDEAMLVDLTGRILRSLGYQVTTRTSSVEALELFRARQEDFDLVITDMTMPNMTGADLAREILAIRPGMPVILCTGYSEIMSAEQAREIGIRGYVMKPMTRRDLGLAIREALEGEVAK